MAKDSHQEKKPIVITLGGNKRAQRDAVAEVAIAFLSQPGRYKIQCIRCGYNSAGEYDLIHRLRVDTDQSEANTMIHIGVDPSLPIAKDKLRKLWGEFSYWCLYQLDDDSSSDGIGDIVKGNAMSQIGRARIRTQKLELADLAEQALQEKGYHILKRTGHPEKPDINNTILHAFAGYVATKVTKFAYDAWTTSSSMFP